MSNSIQRRARMLWTRRDYEEIPGVVRVEEGVGEVTLHFLGGPPPDYVREEIRERSQAGLAVKFV